MAEGKGRKKLFLYLGLGLLALPVLLSIWVPQTAYPRFTSYSPRADGVKAFYLLLERLNFLVEHLTEPAPKGRGMMIMVEPEGLAEAEASQVLGWVNKGNTLLLLSGEPNPLVKQLNLNLSKKTGTTGEVEIKSDHRYLRDVRKLTLISGQRLQAHPRMAFSYGDETGEFLAVVKQGEGEVIILTEPGLITNGQIQKEDNLVLFLNLVRSHQKAVIWFNELVHGYTWAASAREVLTWPIRLVMVQLALGILLLFHYWGKRFGRPLPLPREKDQITGDYVSSMANIYRQGRARQITLENLYLGFRRDLTRYLGVPANLENEALVKIFTQRPGIDAEGLSSLLRRCEADLVRHSLSEMELFTLAQELEIWRRENLAPASERRKPNE